jgi:flagellar assembly factor FliW
MTALSQTSVVGEADANQVVRSQWLGEIEFGPSSELLFPVGLPGFEGERGMLPVEIPAQKPLVYLQSLTNPEVCFVSLPVFIVDSGFHLHLSDDERSILQLNGDGDPTIGVDVLCLALLMPSLGTVRVNLNAPVVINLHNSRGVQCVSEDTDGGFYRLAENGHWESAC